MTTGNSTETTPPDRPPAWVRDAVFYQIFPDRFARSDTLHKPHNLEPWDAPPTVHGYKGGDLVGIAEHLDHLVELGVTALYLNPIFASGSNHRYHTWDYHRVDPLLGGDAALERLLTDCRAAGIRVVLDGVFNHASRGFFQFHDIMENGPSSPWVDWFSIHSFPVDAYGPDAPNYGAWWNLPALPKFNTENHDVREYLWEVGERWASMTDGWRLDVPLEISTGGFWEEFRRRVRAANPEAYIVAEIWGDAADHLQGDRFDAAMNYLVSSWIVAFAAQDRVDPAYADHPEYRLRPSIDAGTFAERLRWYLGRYPRHAVEANLNLVDSHDTARILTVCQGDRRSVELIWFLLFTFPGAPCLYYGDEIGMEGGNDPDCRRSFPWDRPETWDRELLETARSLTALRHAHPTLRRGGLDVISAEGDLFVYTRTDDEGTLVGAVNAAEEAAAAAVAWHGPTSPTTLWGDGGVAVADGSLRVALAPRGAALWRLD